MILEPLEESLFNVLTPDEQEMFLQKGAVPVNDKFVPLYDLPKDVNVVVLIGGRGGVKTTEGSRFVSLQSSVNRKRTAILRDEKELIRESILNEVLLRFDDQDKYWNFSSELSRLDTGLKEKATGQMLVFSKGFRASANLKNANLKSVSDIDIALVEEAEDIRDVQKYNTFADSIRKEGSLIIIILNTPDVGHWLMRRYFNLTPINFDDVPELKGKVTEKDLDGYFKISPKKIPGFFCIQSSFTDNPHLPDHILSNYKGYGDPNSHLYDLHYYLTAIKGYASSGRKGQVFKKIKRISLKDYLALPYKEIYGQDFGTTSPAGLIGLKRHRNDVYVREMNYLPKDLIELGKLYCSLGLHSSSDKIIADIAGKSDIAKLNTGWEHSELDSETLKQFPGLIRGWDIQGWPKKEIQSGVRLMNSLNIHIVEESKGFWDPEKGEVIKYVYAQDKNGNYTDDPIDAFNHLWDPTRYVIEYTEQQQGGGMQRTN